MLTPDPGSPRETLAQKEYWAHQMHYVRETLDTLKDYLGAEPVFEFDKASWWPHRARLDALAASPFGRSDGLLWALIMICKTHPQEVPYLRESIRRIVCGYGGEDSGFRLELTDGVLRYDVELNKPDPDAAIAERLKTLL